MCFLTKSSLKAKLYLYCFLPCGWKPHMVTQSWHCLLRRHSAHLVLIAFSLPVPTYFSPSLVPTLSAGEHISNCHLLCWTQRVYAHSSTIFQFTPHPSLCFIWHSLLLTKAILWGVVLSSLPLVLPVHVHLVPGFHFLASPFIISPIVHSFFSPPITWWAKVNPKVR